MDDGMQQVARLSDRARQRLVQIAADLVGRAATEDVPAALRAIARFAPAKRARLGASVLAATLDSDGQFRSAVLDLVRSADPSLVQGVVDGLQLTASDPADVAVVAYLARPDGWQQLVREDARLELHQPARVAELEAELEAVRARLASSQRRVTQRADTESSRVSELSEQLATARREGRRASSELDNLRGELSRLRQELAAAEQRASVADTAHAAELRRMRARVQELEASGITARREARATREIDDARLWLLVDTLVQSAAGIRRELDLAPPTILPGDLVGAQTAPSPTAPSPTGPTNAAGLERMLSLPGLHLIVDGYNVTKTGYPELPLADQRARLVSSAGALAARTGVEITLAFDGAASGVGVVAPLPIRGVRVLFSRGEIADDLIRRLIVHEPEGRPILVVTNDQAVVADARRAGCRTASSEALLARLS